MRGFQFESVVHSVLVGHHEVGQELGELEEVVSIEVNVLEDVGVAPHIVADGVVDLRDLGDVEGRFFFVVEVLLQFGASLVDEH